MAQVMRQVRAITAGLNFWGKPSISCMNDLSKHTVAFISQSGFIP